MRISDWSSDVCSSDLLVGRVAQKLVNQVAVGAVYFHTIKAGGNGVACALSKRSHDAGNLFDGQGARHRVRHLALGRVDLTLNGGGAAGDNGGAIGSARVGCAASVPDLHEDRSEEHTSELQ